ncbi:hypothetical protein HID58_043084, partial [Brassica napus]
LRDHVSLCISFSSNSPNTTEARTSPITEARASPIWNILSQLYFKQTNRYFSVCGNRSLVPVVVSRDIEGEWILCLSLDDCFMIKSSMNIDCCDCICFLLHCSQTPRAFQEEEAGETSDCRMEEEIETAHVSPAKKRKNHYQDIGAESRKKRLLCQRSTDKYRDLEEGMKSYIQGMFKSSFTALGLEVRDLIEDRFTKLEQTILSSQTQIGVPAYTQTHAHGAAPAYTPTPAAATTSTQAHAPTPTPASTHASAPAPTTSRSRASRNKALVSSDTGGPANAAKTRSQTKDPDLSDVFGSLFDTLDVNLGTQEHLQKTMGNLTQESHVRVAYDPEVRWKDSDYELVFVPEDKCSKLSEWILKSKVLQIGPSNFDAELASRIMGPNEWLKNYDMDAMMYLFREKISLRRWKPNRVAFMNCMFSNQIITAYGKVAQEMKQKLKIATVAMVVVGAIVGIWTSL